MFERGQVVRSISGRDKDKFLVIVEVGERFLRLSDGKERPLERPKLKNQKHVSPTAKKLSEEQLKTNKSVRHALRDLLGADS